MNIDRETTEDTMTDDKMQPSKTPPNVKNDTELTKPEQGHQQARENQASAAAQPGRHVAPGRRPLFRA